MSSVAVVLYASGALGLGSPLKPEAVQHFTDIKRQILYVMQF